MNKISGTDKAEAHLFHALKSSQLLLSKLEPYPFISTSHFIPLQSLQIEQTQPTFNGMSNSNTRRKLFVGSTASPGSKIASSRKREKSPVLEIRKHCIRQPQISCSYLHRSCRMRSPWSWFIPTKEACLHPCYTGLGWIFCEKAPRTVWYVPSGMCNFERWRRCMLSSLEKCQGTESYWWVRRAWSFFETRWLNITIVERTSDVGEGGLKQC